MLVIGDERLASTVRPLLPEVTVEYAETSEESEGLGVSLVVIAGIYPLLEAAQIRVHPGLSDAPAIVLAPSHLRSDALSALRIDVVDLSADVLTLVAAISERLEATATSPGQPPTAEAQASA